MAFPASLTVITVTGTYVKYPSGTPATGKIRFISKVLLQGPTDNVIVEPFDISVLLDSAGSFSIQLPATNDPDWTPVNWTYAVELILNNKVISGSLALPYNGGPVDLADAFNSAFPVPGQSYVLLSARGAPGGVAGLDVNGHVPVAELPFNVLVLGPTDPVPSGTPVNTVIVRTT